MTSGKIRTDGRQVRASAAPGVAYSALINVIISCTWCLLTLCAVAQAPDKQANVPAGTVVAVRGDVEIVRGNDAPAAVALKDPVYQHDTIRTGRRGRIQIVFTDDTVVSLGRNTELTITECLFEPSDGKGAMRLDIREGVFRVMGGAIMRIAPENFKAETPTSTIGIRGSSFAGETTGELTLIALLATTGDGIYVENQWGRTDLTQPGDGTRVEKGLPPAPPRPMAELVARLLSDTHVGGGNETPDGTGGDGLEIPPADDDEDQDLGPQGGQNLQGPTNPADPHDVVDGYEETYAADIPTPGPDNEPDDGAEPPVVMGAGFVAGWDPAAQWSWLNALPEQVQVTADVNDGTLGEVTDGRMTVAMFANGSTDETRTEGPAGPQQSPPMTFEFSNGTVLGNDVVAVTQGTVQAENTTPDYMNWGYWDVRIANPNNPSDSRQVRGVWQATSLLRTAVETMRDVLLDRNFIGHYRGDAHCIRNGVDPLNGASTFHFNFQDRTFSGDLDFQAGGGPAMEFDGRVDEAGFRGRVNTVGTQNTVGASPIHGAFFGSDGHTVGAAFSAHTPIDHYIGTAGARFTDGEPVNPANRRLK